MLLVTLAASSWGGAFTGKGLIREVKARNFNAVLFFN